MQPHAPPSPLPQDRGWPWVDGGSFFSEVLKENLPYDAGTFSSRSFIPRRDFGMSTVSTSIHVAMVTTG